MTPSKAAATFGGQFLIDSQAPTFAPEQFSSDERLMADVALQFSKGEVLPNLERIDAQEEGLMPELVRKACELGFGGPDTPEEFGGLGLSKSVATRILEMLSLNGSFSTTIGVQQGVAQLPIVLFGNEDQKRRYLPRLTTGEWIGAYALSEPNSGSDAMSVTSRALHDETGYKITGTKMWISNAKWAKLFATFAKIDGDQFSCFLIERDYPGVEVSREEHKMGLKGSSTARLILDNCAVPAENLLYEPGMGHRVALNALNIGRCKIGAMALGQARSALHIAAKYASERKQFGQAIANFGLVREKLARMAALMFGAESTLYRTAGLLDDAFARRNASLNPIEENRKACEEFQIECSLTKVLTTEVLATVVDEALQIHGGYGFTEEFAAARLYRDARVMRIYEGTNEINRVFAFDRIVKRGVLQKMVDAAPSCPAHAYLIQAGRTIDPAQLMPQEMTACMSDLMVFSYAQQAVMRRAERMEQVGHSFAEFATFAAESFVSMTTAMAAAKCAEFLSRSGRSESIALEPGHCNTKLAETVLEVGGYPL